MLYFCTQGFRPGECARNHLMLMKRATALRVYLPWLTIFNLKSEVKIDGYTCYHDCLYSTRR